MTDRRWQLTEAEQREIQRWRDELGTKFCHRCDYCQPCTMEIPISTVMFNSTATKHLPAEQLFSGTISEALEKAANCTECGDCEERCPFNLPIRETLAEQVKRYQEEKKKYQERTTTKSSR